MPTVYDVSTNEIISKTAQELKAVKEIKPPDWAPFVKTGMHRERPPQQQDWWYVRAAAILLTVRKKGPIGVEKLRTKYGGKKNRGHKPEKFYKGSGNIIRKVLQQLEAAQLIKHVKIGVHKGRVATKQGMSLLDKNAKLIYQSQPKSQPKTSQAPAGQHQKAPEQEKAEETK